MELAAPFEAYRRPGLAARHAPWRSTRLSHTFCRASEVWVLRFFFAKSRMTGTRNRGRRSLGKEGSREGAKAQRREGRCWRWWVWGIWCVKCRWVHARSAMVSSDTIGAQQKGIYGFLRGFMTGGRESPLGDACDIEKGGAARERRGTTGELERRSQAT